MRRFVLEWKTLGLEARLQTRIVSFADDFVICGRGTGGQAMEAMRAMMGKLKLAVNEAKTGRCRIPQAYFDFLSYTFGRCYSTQTGRACIGTRQSSTLPNSMIWSFSSRIDALMAHAAAHCRKRDRFFWAHPKIAFPKQRSCENNDLRAARTAILGLLRCPKFVIGCVLGLYFFQPTSRFCDRDLFGSKENRATGIKKIPDAGAGTPTSEILRARQ